MIHPLLKAIYTAAADNYLFISFGINVQFQTSAKVCVYAFDRIYINNKLPADPEEYPRIELFLQRIQSIIGLIFFPVE